MSSATAEKAKAQRLQRLKSSIDEYLEHPEGALETLMTELEAGEPHTESWEGLHAAAARDGKDAELGQVYAKVAVDRRMKQLTPPQRATVLLHAADYFQGILGDRAAAEGYLWRVLEAVPDHADAFARLERRYNAARDRVRLVELHALVAARPPRPPAAFGKAVLDIISLLPSASPVPDDACRRLLVLLPATPELIEVLETHCRNTGRFRLACELLEASLETSPGSKEDTVERRRHLTELYVGEAKTPEKAISHVEYLLNQDPSDAQARAAGERLLRHPEVASRAAAAIQAARRNLRERG